MDYQPNTPPRVFHAAGVALRDCGRIALSDDEQVTFTTPQGGAYDVVRKAWGFYATPSLNGRLPRHRLHGVLAANEAGRAFVLLVEDGEEAAFQAYCRAHQLTVLCRLDTDEAVARLAEALAAVQPAPTDSAA